LNDSQIGKNKGSVWIVKNLQDQFNVNRNLEEWNCVRPTPL